MATDFNKEFIKFKELILKNNPHANIDLIKKAYDFGVLHHNGQKRNSGEDYFIHPIAVASNLSDMKLDDETICAGLMHDVLEDTDVTRDEMKAAFGEEITFLVDGVTKLKNLNYTSKEEKQAENIRKMVLAMAQDIRVIIVKLADRLHNMRTLEYMTDAKKIEKATETVEIYAPIADRLGMSRIKWELEDLSLRYLDENGYYELVEMVNKRRNEREDLINHIISLLEENLEKVGIECEIKGRPKNFYSIYKKMKKKGKVFDEIYDLSAVRILTHSVKDCYGALGVVHTLFKPIPGRFKDYIAMPKPNKYQSLHTTVIDNNGETFEVQIRTYEMHQTAEYGIAAHWKYKAGVSKETAFDENLTWLRQLLEWQKDLNDPGDFMDTLKIDFFADEVFVFTPRGDVINLPEGSTPIDFAYRIHSQVGNTCVGAKVNGRIVPLNYTLQSGNIVDVITNPNTSPSLDWLKIVKSPQARKKISQYFKVKDKEKNIERGRDAIEREVKKQGYEVHKILRDDWLEEVRQKLNMLNLDEMYAAVGFGTITTAQVTAKLCDIYNKFYKKDEKDVEEIVKSKNRYNNQGIEVKGVDGVNVRIAKCCTPVPGDDIVGYITIGRGISVHRKDCKNMQNNVEQARLVEVKWENSNATSYSASIEIRAFDKPNVIGDIANRVNESKLSISYLNAKVIKNGDAVIDITVEITDSEELERLMEKLKRINNVLEVYRVKA